MPGQQSKNRRELIAEGRSLIASILGGPAPNGAVRRYVRGVERYDGGAPLALPALARRCPAAFEPVGGGGASPLGRRFALALRVVEATPQGNALTHAPMGLGLRTGIWRLMVFGLREAVLLPLRLVLGRGR